MYVASEHPSIPQDVWMTLMKWVVKTHWPSFEVAELIKTYQRKCVYTCMYIYNHTWFAEDVELIKTSCTCAWKSLDLHKNPGLHFFVGHDSLRWIKRFNMIQSPQPQRIEHQAHPSHEPIPVVSSPPSLLRKFFTRDAWWSRAMSGDVCKPGEPPLNNWKKCGEAEFNVVKLGVILV